MTTRLGGPPLRTLSLRRCSSRVARRSASPCARSTRKRCATDACCLWSTRGSNASKKGLRYVRATSTSCSSLGMASRRGGAV